MVTGSKPISCKKYAIVSALNVRTPNPIEKRGEQYRKKIDITCMQKHCWFYDSIDVHLRLDAGYCFLHKKYQ